MAITATEIFHTIMGDRAVGVYELSGFDGTANGVSVPFGIVDCAFRLDSTGASIAAAGVTIAQGTNGNLDFHPGPGTANNTMFVMIIGTN